MAISSRASDVARSPQQPWTTWGGSASCSPAHRFAARSVDDVVTVVRRARTLGLTVRAVGAGHSFSPVATTDGVMLSLDALDHVDRPVRLPAPEGRVTHEVRVGAGIRLHALNDALASHGLALSNLGDIDRQSVAGAISTGTHGTGGNSGTGAGLAAQVRAVEVVVADGSVVRASRHENTELFEAARLGLGALGILVAVTVGAEPAYVLEAREEPWPLERALEAVADGSFLASDHAELYWFPHTRTALTKRNARRALDDAPVDALRGWVDDELLSNGVFELTNRLAHAAPAAIPAINRVSARALGARRFTAPSYEVFVSQRRVRFVESEWAVPLDTIGDVLRDVQDWFARTDERVSFPVEVRFARADDVWLSTSYGRPTAYVAVHQFWRTNASRYFAAVQEIASAYDGRPHWGKIHTLGAERLRGLYPRFDDFLAVRDCVDPDGVFTNRYLERVLGR